MVRLNSTSHTTSSIISVDMQRIKKLADIVQRHVFLPDGSIQSINAFKDVLNTGFGVELLLSEAMLLTSWLQMRLIWGRRKDFSERYDM